MSDVDGIERFADPLRIDRCPDCGYLLRGLPRRGLCPECGFAYDGTMIVLYGWQKGEGPGERSSWRHHTVTLVSYAWLPLLAMAFWRYPAGLLTWLQTLWGAIAVAALITPMAVTLWLRSRRSIEGPVPLQLRMMPAGLALRDGVGPVELRPWKAGMGVNFEPIGPGRQLLYSEYNGQRVAWWEGLEVECDPQAAGRVRRRVARWCSTATRQS